jgi:microcystin-dependent protein
MAKILNKVTELESRFNELDTAAKFLKCGHPILMLENALDIANFSFSTGLGSKCWEGWAICNGAIYESPVSGDNIQTPNMLNRFPVGAGDEYGVGDIGGLKEVVLSVPELPAHAHTVTDAGHTHNIVDPGHNHGASSAAHTHTFTSSPHSHTVTVDGVGDHVHGTGFTIIGDDNTGTDFNARNDGVSGSATGPGGSHTHTATAAPSGVAGTIGNASAAVTVENAFTGIGETELSQADIVIDETGENSAHENRPPYFAVLYVIKL